MPYVAINTSKLLSDTEKKTLKAALGEKIAIIPGKSEQRLMVDISDGHTMYLAGEQQELAYVDVKCFGTTALVNKQAFTQGVFEVLQQTTGLSPDSIYLTYSEFEHWGMSGSLK